MVWTSKPKDLSVRVPPTPRTSGNSNVIGCTSIKEYCLFLPVDHLVQQDRSIPMLALITHQPPERRLRYRFFLPSMKFDLALRNLACAVSMRTSA
jgi:hypothetical protein